MSKRDMRAKRLLLAVLLAMSMQSYYAAPTWAADAGQPIGQTETVDGKGQSGSTTTPAADEAETSAPAEGEEAAAEGEDGANTDAAMTPVTYGVRAANAGNEDYGIMPLAAQTFDDGTVVGGVTFTSGNINLGGAWTWGQVSGETWGYFQSNGKGVLTGVTGINDIEVFIENNGDGQVIAIGTSPSDEFAFSAVGLGGGNTLQGAFVVSIGQNAAATSDGATAVGSGTSAEGLYSTAIGANTFVTAENSTGVGYFSRVSAESSTAIGVNTTIAKEFTNSVAIGADSVVSAKDQVSFGHKAGEKSESAGTYESDMFRSLVNVKDLELNTAADGTGGAIKGVTSINDVSIETILAGGGADLGNITTDLNVKASDAADAATTFSIDHSTGNVTTVGNINMGGVWTWDGDGKPVTNGKGALTGVTTINGMVFGSDYDNARDSILLGTFVDDSIFGEGSVLMGRRIKSIGGLSSVGIGFNIEINGEGSTAIGDSAKAISSNGGMATAIGGWSRAIGDTGVAVGGYSATTHEYSVAIGYESVTSADNQISFGHKKGDSDGDGTPFSDDEFRSLVNVKDIELNTADDGTGGAITGLSSINDVSVAGTSAGTGLTVGGNATIGKTDTPFSSKGFSVDKNGAVTAASGTIGNVTFSKGDLDNVASINGANLDMNHGIGFGWEAYIYGSGAIAIGDEALSGDDSGVGYGGTTAIGTASAARKNYSTALGSNADVNAERGTALGYMANTDTNVNSVAIGSASKAFNDNEVNFGYYNLDKGSIHENDPYYGRSLAGISDITIVADDTAANANNKTTIVGSTITVGGDAANQTVIENGSITAASINGVTLEIDASSHYKVGGVDVTQLQTDVAGKADTTTVNELSSKVDTAGTDISALQTTVGDSTKGLVKQVSDMDAAYQAADTQIRTDFVSADATLKTDLTKAFGDADIALKNELNTEIGKKANKSTTLEGYGITDAYTKTETNVELAKKVDVSAYNSKMSALESADAALSGRATDLEAATAGISVDDGTTKLANGFKVGATTYGMSSDGALTAASITEGGKELSAKYADKDTVDTLSGTVSTLNDTVGDGTKGLVKDTADLKAEDAKIRTDFASADTTLKNELNTEIGKKANVATTLAGYGITDAYTKTETTTAISTATADMATKTQVATDIGTAKTELTTAFGDADAALKTDLTKEIDKKANKSTTLEGYGITDAYTKTAADTAISTAKTELTTAFGNADAALKTTLETAYQAADATLQSNIDAKVAQNTYAEKMGALDSADAALQDRAGKLEAATVGISVDDGTTKLANGFKVGATTYGMSSDGALTAATVNGAAITSDSFNGVSIKNDGTVDGVDVSALKATVEGIKTDGVGTSDTKGIERTGDGSGTPYTTSIEVNTKISSGGITTNAITVSGTVTANEFVENGKTLANTYGSKSDVDTLTANTAGISVADDMTVIAKGFKVGATTYGMTSTGALTAATVNGAAITSDSFNSVSIKKDDTNSDVIVGGINLSELSKGEVVTDNTQGIEHSGTTGTDDSVTTIEKKTTISSSGITTNSVTASGTVTANEFVENGKTLAAKYADKDTVDTLSGTVSTLNDTVGDTTKGLVKDTADLKAEDAKIRTDFASADATLKTDLTTEIDKKANKATTLVGYGITDAYTKDETTTAITTATADMATKTQVATDIGTAKTELTTAFGDADTTLETELTTAFGNADAALKTELEKAYKEANTQIKTDFAAADAALQSNIDAKVAQATYDEKMSALDKADTALSGRADKMEVKTANFNADGDTLTGMANITSTAATLGGVSFADGGTVTGVKSINTVKFDDVGNIEGGTYNGVSIKKNDTNSDVIVGGINLSDLSKGEVVTENTKGIEHSGTAGTDNSVTTIEKKTTISSSGITTNAITASGTVTANEFVEGSQKLSDKYAGKDTVYTKTEAEGAFADKSTVDTLADNTAGISVDCGTTKLANGFKVGTTAYGMDSTGVLTAATVNGATITNDSFNNVSIKKDGSNYTVGDVDVTALKATVGTAESDIGTLKTKVGDADNGLVKDTAELQSMVKDTTKGLEATNKIAVANAGDIVTLKTAATGMSYDSGTTTFAGGVAATVVTAGEFKVGATGFGFNSEGVLTAKTVNGVTIASAGTTIGSYSLETMSADIRKLQTDGGATSANTVAISHAGTLGSADSMTTIEENTKISSSGIVVTGTVEATTLKEGGTELSVKYATNAALADYAKTDSVYTIAAADTTFAKADASNLPADVSSWQSKLGISDVSSKLVDFSYDSGVTTVGGVKLAGGALNDVTSLNGKAIGADDKGITIDGIGLKNLSERITAIESGGVGTADMGGVKRKDSNSDGINDTTEIEGVTSFTAGGMQTSNLAAATAAIGGVNFAAGGVVTGVSSINGTVFSSDGKIGGVSLSGGKVNNVDINWLDQRVTSLESGGTGGGGTGGGGINTSGITKPDGDTTTIEGNTTVTGDGITVAQGKTNQTTISDDGIKVAEGKTNEVTINEKGIHVGKNSSVVNDEDGFITDKGLYIGVSSSSDTSTAKFSVDKGNGTMTSKVGGYTFTNGSSGAVFNHSGDTAYGTGSKLDTTIEGNKVTTGQLNADELWVGGNQVTVSGGTVNQTDAIDNQLTATKDGYDYTNGFTTTQTEGTTQSASKESTDGKEKLETVNKTTAGGTSVTTSKTSINSADRKTEQSSSFVTNESGMSLNTSTKVTDKDGNVTKNTSGETKMSGDSLTVSKKTVTTKDGKTETKTSSTEIGSGEVTLHREDGSTIRVGEAIEGMQGQIQDIGSKVNKMGVEIKEVGALSAALAGLHPQPENANSRADFAMAMGSYEGKQALAVGGFYRPDKRTMLSIGASTTSSKHMMNMGISIALDRLPEEERKAQEAAAADPETLNKVLERLAALEQDNQRLQADNKKRDIAYEKLAADYTQLKEKYTEKTAEKQQAESKLEEAAPAEADSSSGE